MLKGMRPAAILKKHFMPYFRKRGVVEFLGMSPPGLPPKTKQQGHGFRAQHWDWLRSRAVVKLNCEGSTSEESLGKDRSLHNKALSWTEPPSWCSHRPRTFQASNPALQDIRAELLHPCWALASIACHRLMLVQIGKTLNLGALRSLQRLSCRNRSGARFPPSVSTRRARKREVASSFARGCVCYLGQHKSCPKAAVTCVYMHVTCPCMPL